MKRLSTDTYFARTLSVLARSVLQYRWWWIAPQLVLFGICVFYARPKQLGGYLELDMDRDNLVGKNMQYHKAFMEFKGEFPAQDDLVVVAESEDPEKNRQFVERLGPKLEAAKVRVPWNPKSKELVDSSTNLFRDVFYKGDLKMLGTKALLFVPDEPSSVFLPGDIRDLPALIGTLTNHTDAVSTYIYERLSPQTKDAMRRPAETNQLPLVQRLLATNLNVILTGPSIFDSSRFSGITLRPQTQQFLKTHDPEKVVQLNRLLLEDAFPQEISRNNLEELLRALRDYRPFIEQFTRTTNLATFFDMVNWQFGHAKREKNAENDALVKALPALERIIRQAKESMLRPGVPPSPGVTALFDAGSEAQQQEYITFDRGRMFLVTAHSPSADLNNEAVVRLRELVAETAREVPGLNVGITGSPVLQFDEMHQSEKDSLTASIVSLVICALIFIYGYQETGRPIKATICLVIGLAYTMAYTTLVVGHLNVLTLTFVPMLIGLAIDFGVHLVTRYEEELRHGKSEQDALVKAMVFTGQGIFTGAMTTAGAFFAMAFTNFKGIREMGIICGGGLVICLIPMMTILPVLLLRGRQNVIDHEFGKKLEARARIENLWLRRPAFVAIMTLLFCLIAAVYFRKVTFDYDLLNMQSEGLAAVEFEKKLIFAPNATRSVLFAAVVADNLEEAVALEAKIKTIPRNIVASVDSISHFLNADQTNKLVLIGEIKKELANLRFPETDCRVVDMPKLRLSLYSLQGYLGAALDVVEKEDPVLAKPLSSLKQAIMECRVEMLRGSEKDAEARAVKLGAFQRALFNDVHDTFEALRTQDNSAPLRVEDLPEPLRDRFVGKTGKFVLQVYPHKDIWQRENQREFIQTLRSTLDPDGNDHPIITGTPVQLYEYITLLKNSYEQAAIYSLIAIILLVAFHFRSLLSVILALVPVAIGTLWLGGLMGLCDIQFNPANIMTLPLVIGIGVTNGIHILNRYAEEQTPSILAKSTGKAVLVSGLTAIAGFGSLIIAQHQGIRSLGYVMATGIATCMIAGLTFLPALLNLLERGKPTKNQPSADNARSTLGREEPR
jgi:hopanoid biosynthesis associated RND transporter like protein HpnN